MLYLKPGYVTDADGKKIAVQLSIKTFKTIEEVLENYGLYHLMNEEPDESLQVKEAQAYYGKLKKKK